MGRENRLIGQTGEMAALQFLKNKGYKILETNARTALGEIDIVAVKGGFTIFVEVKTRSTSSLGPPYLSITRLKQRHIINNALCYLKRLGRVNTLWRIDVVSVNLGRDYKVAKIELIENAVEDNN